MLKYLLLGLFPLFALALQEKTLDTDWRRLAYPHYTSAKLQSFVNAQRMNLYFRSFTNPSHKKVLVILPGRTEPALKFAELIYDLRNSGFDFHILDHQGQGDSDRLLSDPHKGYVVSFQDYVKDLTQWMNEHVLPKSQGKEITILAHSMGGAIAVNYLAQNPGIVRKAVLVAPMMEVNTKPYKEKTARLLSNFLVKIGRGKAYATGRTTYVPENDLFESNEVTHSLPRFEITKSIFTEWPELALGGPTSRWVRESLRATRNIDQLAEKIPTPILLLQAGEDKIVKLPRQTKFCAKAPSCKLVHFEKSAHEILMESDEIRDRALSEILSFL